jgi:hypothetical protein
MAVTAQIEHVEQSRNAENDAIKRSFETYIKSYGVEEGIKRVVLLSSIFRQKMVKNDEAPAEAEKDNLERYTRIAGEVIGDAAKARKLICL